MAKAAGLTAALLACIVGARLRRAHEHQTRVYLLIESESEPALRPAVSLNARWTVAALSPAQRLELLSTLERLSDRVHIAQNPTVVDLAEGSLEDDVAKVQARYKPLAIATHQWALGQWQDESMRVRVVDRCPMGAFCINPFSPPSADTRDLHARALAWAWTHATLIEVAAPEQVAAALEALQQTASAPDSSLAAAFSAESLSNPLPAPELAAAATALRNELPAQYQEARAWLDALALKPVGEPAPLPLRPKEILILPRLSAVARAPAVQSEIHQALPQIPFHKITP